MKNPKSIWIAHNPFESYKHVVLFYQPADDCLTASFTSNGGEIIKIPFKQYAIFELEHL